MDAKVELVMIVAPLIGHLTPSLELAKLMLTRSTQLSITVLIMEVPNDAEGTAKVQSVVSGCSEVDRLHFHHLPTPQDTSEWHIPHRGHFVNQLLEHHKSNVRETISKIDGLSGVIIDFMSTIPMEIADDLGVPSFLFFASGAAFVGLLLHFQTLEDEHNKKVSDLVETETDLTVPYFLNRVPVRVLPVLITHPSVWNDVFLKFTRAFRRAKGIIVNTFDDLESHPLKSFSLDSSYGKSGLPPIYPVGPVLNRFPFRIQTPSTTEHSEMMRWLDAQPENSVVFLCFGSMGSLKEEQLKEIAYALERTGFRYIWVLRRRPSTNEGFVSEFEDPGLVLPPGFLDRTATIGRAVGWVPQFSVLSHPAVGGFVSHCGWNSTLESIWSGVPMATWPLHAEQQLNAFEIVKELGIAVEISLDFKENDDEVILKSEQIEKGLRDLMNVKNEVRKRVQELSEKARLAVAEGGSSYLSLGNLIHTLI